MWRENDKNWDYEVQEEKKKKGIIKVYKALVEDNTWLQTNWELSFLLFLS